METADLFDDLEVGDHRMLIGAQQSKCPVVSIFAKYGGYLHHSRPSAEMIG